MTMFHTDTPSDTPARSCAVVCPTIATSATDMPTLASCPTRMGQANNHKAVISSRTARAVNADLNVERGRSAELDMQAVHAP